MQAETLTLDASGYKSFDKLLLVARKCILIRWIKEIPPSVTQWYKEIFTVLPHERIAKVLWGVRPLLLKEDLRKLVEYGLCSSGVYCSK